MSSLVEIAKDLEYVPDEQLVTLANGSDPRFPPFVVISEIKRRTDMRSRVSEPMPKSTVAQEMIQEFATPSTQGLEGMSRDTTGILPPTVYDRDMPSSMMADGGLTSYNTGDKTELTPTYVVPGGYYANPKFIDAVDKGELFLDNEFKYMKPEKAGDTAYNYLMNVKGEPEKVISKPRKQYFDSAGDAILEGVAEVGNMMFNPSRQNINDTKQLSGLFAGREKKREAMQDMLTEAMTKRQENFNRFASEKREAFKNRMEMSGEMREQYQREYKGLIENAKAKNLPSEFLTLQLEGLARKYEKLAPFQELQNIQNIEITPKFNPLVEGGKKIKGNEMIARVEGKQEGGLTGYQTGNQTALSSSFIYGDNYYDMLQDFQDMQRKVRTMDEKEQAYLSSKNQTYPMLNTNPEFDMDMTGIVALAPTQTDLNSELVMQTENSTPLSESKSLDYLEKQLEAAKENLKNQKARGDRGGLGGGSSYIDEAQAQVDRLQKQKDSKRNQKSFIVDTQNLLKESVGEETEALATAIQKQEDKEAEETKIALDEIEAEKNKFSNIGIDLPERTSKPRTKQQMQQELNANVLMSLGTAIGGSATPSELFGKLSGLPAQLTATRREQRKEIKDFEDTRRADALAKLNVQINLRKLDQAAEMARLKGEKNTIDTINSLSSVLTTTMPGDARHEAAANALDSIIASLSGKSNSGLASVSELFVQPKEGS